MPYLIDDPRLIYYDGNLQPVSVVKETPFISLEKQKKKGFNLTSNITLSELKSCKDDYIIKKISNTSYVVIPITQQQAHIFHTLLEQKSFPNEAEEALKALLPKLRAKIKK